jgi:hypothetical protein
MTFRVTRRAAFLLPLLLAACADDEPVRSARRDFPPLRYGYLPPISLNVQRVEMSEGGIPGAPEGEIIGSSPVSVADTLYSMARDRLKPVAPGGVATFRIVNASIVRRRDALQGVLAVRLDVRGADETSTGYAEARVTATRSGPVRDQAAAVYDMLKSMMDDMNIEFEFQIRNKLRAWIAEPSTPPGAPAEKPRPAAPPETLPQPPPPPPPPPA